ncbi:hypothetical protein [Microbacterium sp.]|uniref:hypothetical protein n=1 Tax=Microbacterium sp. TaxID=51671 RepID=UPI0028A22A4A|nr:hypothetical protein [Microbacterium sp.]
MSAQGGEPPTVSVSIRTVAGEEQRAEELAGQLDGALVRICRTSAETEAAAWQPWTRRATHHLVLDAAVRPHPRLLAQVHAAVAGRPAAALRLFTPGDGYVSHASRVAAFSGRPWVVPPGPDASSVATVLPVPEAARLARSVEVGDGTPEGVLLHRFAAERGLDLLASTADLVQVDRPGSYSPATAFLPSAVAPEEWWQREPLPSSPSIPVVHLRDGEPLSYEAVPGTPDGWRLRPRRDVPTPHARRFARLMHELLLGTEVARSHLRAAAVLLGVAGVLRDQLLLASTRGRPTDAFGTAVAREAAATLALGTLAETVPAVGRPDGAAELRDAFQTLYDEMAGILHASPREPEHGGDP